MTLVAWAGVGGEEVPAPAGPGLLALSRDVSAVELETPCGIGGVRTHPATETLRIHCVRVQHVRFGGLP